MLGLSLILLVILLVVQRQCHIQADTKGHSTSTAFEHPHDLQQLGEIDEFMQIMLTNDGSAKPIRIITCDGGPDENLRYEKTIDCAIEQFIQNNFDAIFVATNAPGHSAFNRVERSMAPLSKELASLILPHEHFGSHLDSQGRTVDPDLEHQNVGHAGKVLAEVWSDTIIDGYPVIARYVDGSAVHSTAYSLL